MRQPMPNATGVSGHFHAVRFYENKESLCRIVAIRGSGEMVGLLWQDGQTTAAVRLEMLWNKLAMNHDFSLLCGYSMGSFYKDASMSEICDQHSHVVHANGLAAPAKSDSPFA